VAANCAAGFWRQQQHRDITQLGLIAAQHEGRQALVEQARLAFFAGVVKLAHGPGAFSAPAFRPTPACE
jgi:hypothetical protein